MPTTLAYGPHAFVAHLPQTARQRVAVLGDHLQACDDYNAALGPVRAESTDSDAEPPARVSSLEMMRLHSAIEAAAGAALVRTLDRAEGAKLRTLRVWHGDEPGVDGGPAPTYRGHSEPVLSAGSDLIEELAELGVPPSVSAGAWITAMMSTTPTPAESEVVVAAGN
jgi:hypothetical protein